MPSYFETELALRAAQIRHQEKRIVKLTDALEAAYKEMEEIDTNHSPGLIDIQVLLKAKQALGGE